MPEFLDVDTETLFAEICERGRAEGIADREAYDALVEEIVEEHRRIGEDHDDEDQVSLYEQFRVRFDEYVEGLSAPVTPPDLLEAESQEEV